MVRMQNGCEINSQLYIAIYRSLWRRWWCDLKHLAGIDIETSGRGEEISERGSYIEALMAVCGTISVSGYAIYNGLCEFGV